MDKAPTELEPGKLACPDRRCPLEPGLPPFCHNVRNLGAFDGIACGVCCCGLDGKGARRVGQGDRGAWHAAL